MSDEHMLFIQIFVSILGSLLFFVVCWKGYYLGRELTGKQVSQIIVFLGGLLFTGMVLFNPLEPKISGNIFKDGIFAGLSAQYFGLIFAAGICLFLGCYTGKKDSDVEKS